MSTFQVRNEQIEKTLRAVAEKIKAILPKGWGFTLMLFDYTDTPGGSMFYISSAGREDMINAMKEFIAKNEKGEV